MATTILFNGSIYTMDQALPRAQAIAIRDRRVLAVGSEGKVQAAVGGRAETINLQGRSVIPALTDAHTHLIQHALRRREMQLEGATEIDDVVRRIADVAQARPGGSWIVSGGWDHMRWGGRWPHAGSLDMLIPDHPVLLMRKDGHSAWVNSYALTLAGIDDTTPDPAGGSIQRERGQPTGILFERAIDLVRRHIPPPTSDERLAALREVSAEAHSYGMAGVHLLPGPGDGDAAQTLADVQRLREHGELTLRCLVYLGLDGMDAALRLGLRSGLGDHWVRIGGIKMFADGSLGSETAELLFHYEGRRHLGQATMAQDELTDAVRRALAGGMSVAIHAIGDAANRRALDAIAAALHDQEARVEAPETEAEPSNAHGPSSVTATIPNRIEHAQLVHSQDIPRFAQLGVVASMQPIHCTADMDMADRLWGARCATAYAWRALQDSGTVLAFGSDVPVEPLNPWLGIHAAVTRQRIDKTPPEGWYPEQRLDVTAALHGFTVGAAIAGGVAHEQGALIPGMLADMTILSADPFKIDPCDLHAIQADMTLIEGEVIWERKGT